MHSGTHLCNVRTYVSEMNGKDCHIFNRLDATDWQIGVSTDVRKEKNATRGPYYHHHATPIIPSCC